MVRLFVSPWIEFQEVSAHCGHFGEFQVILAEVGILADIGFAFDIEENLKKKAKKRLSQERRVYGKGKKNEKEDKKMRDLRYRSVQWNEKDNKNKRKTNSLKLRRRMKDET